MVIASRDFLVGLGLRRAGRRLCQRPDDGPPRQVDLKRVVLKPLASLSSRSPARLNVVAVAAWPRSAASAEGSRHGLWATPPRARRASLIRPSSSSSAAATETSANA